MLDCSVPCTPSDTTLPSPICVTKGTGANETKEYPNACYLKAFMCQEHHNGSRGVNLKHVQCYTNIGCPAGDQHQDAMDLHCYITVYAVRYFFGGSVDNFSELFKKLLNNQSG